MTSQMNRGEALRCIQIAKKCIQEQKITKAEKFLKKSLKMYETKEAEALLASLCNPTPQQNVPPNQSQSPNASRTSSTPPNASPQRPQRSSTMPNLNRSNTTPQQSTSSRTSTTSQSSSRMGKAEEVEMVKKILRAKDYYSILGVDKGETDEKKLKKAYRKKALKCHPDRNQAPGAEEAFKKLSKAYDVLRDPRKRQIYDTYGADSPQMSNNGRGAHFQQMSPDDIIRMFFGGDFGGGGFQGGHGFHFGPGFQTRTRRGNRGHQHGQDGGGDIGGPMVYIMQLLPIILVFFTMILPSLMMFGGNSNSSSGGLFGGSRSGGMENVYFSLNKHHPFTLEKKTSLDTTYYVQPSRRGQWGNYNRYKSPRLEQEVENAYLNKLIKECDNQIERENVKLNKIVSNKISYKERQRLIKNLMRNKSKFRKYKSKQCNKLFEYVEEL